MSVVKNAGRALMISAILSAPGVEHRAGAAGAPVPPVRLQPRRRCHQFRWSRPCFRVARASGAAGDAGDPGDSGDAGASRLRSVIAGAMDAIRAIEPMMQLPDLPPIGRSLPMIAMPSMPDISMAIASAERGAVIARGALDAARSDRRSASPSTTSSARREDEDEARQRDDEARQRAEEEKQREAERRQRIDENYQRGQESLERRAWARAAESFTRVIDAQKSTRIDAALYWKAYALDKLNQQADALAVGAGSDQALPAEPLDQRREGARAPGAPERRPGAAARSGVG